MNKILQFALMVVIGSFSMYIFSAIANFFGISYQYYGVYMMFAAAMVLLYFVLPSSTINIFE